MLIFSSLIKAGVADIASADVEMKDTETGLIGKVAPVMDFGKVC